MRSPKTAASRTLRGLRTALTLVSLVAPAGTHTVTAVHTNGDGAESDPAEAISVTIRKSRQ